MKESKLGTLSKRDGSLMEEDFVDQMLSAMGRDTVTGTNIVMDKLDHLKMLTISMMRVVQATNVQQIPQTNPISIETIIVMVTEPAH